MARVLVIPDVHLKPQMFDRAEKILDSDQADFAVQLGDLFDDWDQELNIELYRKTAERAIEFHKKFPKTLWCMGNHDFGYAWEEYGRRETGHSVRAEHAMQHLLLPKMRAAGIHQKVVHIIDKAIFSHAGLLTLWVEAEQARLGYIRSHHVDHIELRRLCNSASAWNLWSPDSPLWARPQSDYNTMTGQPIRGPEPLWSPREYMQVVGHTPMSKVAQYGSLLSTDTFSTTQSGYQIGECRFVIVDTVEKTWRYATEKGEK